MICFDVYRNGEKLCRAGVGDDGVLSAIVSWAVVRQERGPREERGPRKHELRLDVGGLHNPEPDLDVHPRWVDLSDLQIRDEITIRVVESDTADHPVSESRHTREEIRAHQRRYYETLREQFEVSKDEPGPRSDS